MVHSLGKHVFVDAVIRKPQVSKNPTKAHGIKNGPGAAHWSIGIVAAETDIRRPESQDFPFDVFRGALRKCMHAAKVTASCIQIKLRWFICLFEERASK
jgi:hypothetical protein